MKNNILMTVVVVIVVGAAAFFGGMKYQQSKTPANTTGQNGFNGGGARQGAGRFGPGGRGGATIGEIVGMDANSITVKLQDGSSKIVNISDKTTFSKTDTASKSDLKTGARIAAFGSSNSDGSISAQNIQLNPMFRDRQMTPTPSGTK